MEAKGKKPVRHKQRMTDEPLVPASMAQRGAFSPPPTPAQGCWGGGEVGKESRGKGALFHVHLVAFIGSEEKEGRSLGLEREDLAGKGPEN